MVTCGHLNTLQGLLQICSHSNQRTKQNSFSVIPKVKQATQSKQQPYSISKYIISQHICTAQHSKAYQSICQHSTAQQSISQYSTANILNRFTAQFQAKQKNYAVMLLLCCAVDIFCSIAHSKYYFLKKNTFGSTATALFQCCCY